MLISEPSSAKQQRVITKICVVCKRKLRRQTIFISIWNLTLLLYVMLKLSCGVARDSKLMRPFPNWNSFFHWRVPWRCHPNAHTTVAFMRRNIYIYIYVFFFEKRSRKFRLKLCSWLFTGSLNMSLWLTGAWSFRRHYFRQNLKSQPRKSLCIKEIIYKETNGERLYCI